VKGPLHPIKVQFSNSAIYLLHICIVFHILSVLVFIYTRNQKEKTTAGLYIVEGSLPDFQPVPLAFQLGAEKPTLVFT
jgi:hypothetical protein